MGEQAVVAIGGGRGLATVLEGLVCRFGSLTGVVSVADDGGSSGRLRRDLGIVAPGDMRRCLAALVPPGLIRDALEYRFATGVLAGHPAGNVLLASMLELEDDPVVVMDTLAQMVGARGRILPATTERVDLVARAERGIVKGQVAIRESGAIDEIGYAPDDPVVPAAVRAAIVQAHAIVIGPGSLYTSVLAPLVPRLREAIAAASATVIYVANLTSEPGETDGYDLGDHIDAVRRHGIEPDIVLAPESALIRRDHHRIVHLAPVAGKYRERHDSVQLGAALFQLITTAEYGRINEKLNQGDSPS